MRSIFFVFFLLFVGALSYAQQRVLNSLQIGLPDSLASGAREISGAAIRNDILYLLAENRDDHLKVPSSGIYSVSLKSVSENIADTSRPISKYEYHRIVGLESIMRKVTGYQGLEALVISDDRFFATIETEQYADSCYLITGRIHSGNFNVDTNRVVSLKKPLLENGEKVFNAGFEALVLHGRHLYAFFEYNSFPDNSVQRIDTASFASELIPLSEQLAFRTTDMTPWKGRNFIGINYFFPLKAERIYQENLSLTDSVLIQNDTTGLHPMARLVVFRITKKKVRIRNFIEVPSIWWTSNWEGIARYKDGVLMVNDKFIRGGKHETQLIYLHLGKK